MKKLSVYSQVILAIVSLVLIACYFVPVWRIDLFAPQYPEGLVMKIWLTRLTGDIDIINGLNHYIGMKKIDESMFPEFSYLIYVLAGFILIGLAAAITGSFRWLTIYLIMAFLAGVLAIYDFYKWGYRYGHDLDPHAPIKVPGMGYQPPIIGHKKLLNFDAFSLPEIGGYLVIGSVVIAAIIWVIEWRKTKINI
jgi:copper chaperone NosL